MTNETNKTTQKQVNAIPQNRMKRAEHIKQTKPSKQNKSAKHTNKQTD